jgi:hypothetical protein
MQIAELFERVISNSKYIGNFAFDDLMQQMQSPIQSGLAIAEEGSKNYILVFVKGEPEGAALIDENGVLFGNKAVYLLNQNAVFKLFLIDGEFGESLAASCKVYDKSHLRKSITEELPTVGGKKQTLGKLCIIVRKNGELQQGMRVSIRRGRQVLASDVTTVDGRVCFKLLNGRYDCVVMDRLQNLYRFMIDFKDRFVETVVDVGGVNEHEK